MKPEDRVKVSRRELRGYSHAPALCLSLNSVYIEGKSAKKVALAGNQDEHVG
jgi:hypothetical protein